MPATVSRTPDDRGRNSSAPDDACASRGAAVPPENAVQHRRCRSESDTDSHPKRCPWPAILRALRRNGDAVVDYIESRWHRTRNSSVDDAGQCKQAQNDSRRRAPLCGWHAANAATSAHCWSTQTDSSCTRTDRPSAL